MQPSKFFQSKILLCVIALGMSCAVQANVYKCQSANGKTTFSDKPCGTSEQIVEIGSTNLSSTANRKTNVRNSGAAGRPDSLVCPGEPSAKLPAKLCDSATSSYCSFKSEYLKNIVADIEELKDDISDSGVDAIRRNLRSGDELWSFGTPRNEWDAGTGMRGYVVVRRLKAVFYVAALYQGNPNSFPDGSRAFLPQKGRVLKCEDRNILDVIVN